MTEATYKKKLIEVALPLDAINASSEREKQPFTPNHPRSLHIWWARRPLTACRAVLFAQLVDDPSAHPDEFPSEEDQDRERDRLFEIVEDLVKWENINNEQVLEAARAEIRKSCGDDPPPIVDPFAGGGSIPLEAQRLGLKAIASDLNPVAVLINKALIEIPPKWRDCPPVHPGAENRTRWHGAEGLAEDVRRYGQWMRDEAEKRIGHLYPEAKLEDGSDTAVTAWLWARTVTCPNPACGSSMPLVSAFWLGKKKGKEAWVKPIIEDKKVRFEIGQGTGGPPDPPKVGRGAKFRCLVCNEVAPEDSVKAEGAAGRMGTQLMAIVAEGDRRRVYLPPTAEHMKAAKVPCPDNVPEADLPTNSRWFSPPAFGMTQYADLFTHRQLTALTTLSDLVLEVRERAIADATTAASVELPSSYADAISTYLGMALSRWIDLENSLASWNSSNESIRALFARQAIPMVWDFAEANPFSERVGLPMAIELAVRTLTAAPPKVREAEAFLRDSRTSHKGPAITATDPPYYDNIGYADLADFFYVWLRRSLQLIHPSLFATVVTPKEGELVATPYHFDGDRAAADLYFEEGFRKSFAEARASLPPGHVITLFYAFKQAEKTTEGIASTGWDTMLTGLLDAGLMVTATWPMRTERASKISMKANILASSVVLACRPREEAAGITDRQGFIRSLKAELPGALHELQKAHIAPVDLRQAAIGPGMAVFSRYSRVVEPDGNPMPVRQALILINQVLDEVLHEQEAEFDAETRWAIQWFAQHGEDETAFDIAEQLSRAMNVSVDGMERSGILEAGGNKVRLLSREELPDGWDPRSDDRTPVWEATQHMVKRLETDGEQGAADLLRVLGGVGDSVQLLAYRLYNLCEQDRPALAGPYNALVAAWPEIARRAAQAPEEPMPEQQTLES